LADRSAFNIPGNQLFITSEQQRHSEKQKRKDDRRMARRSQAVDEFVLTDGARPSTVLDQAKLDQQASLFSPSSIDDLGTNFAAKMALPQGTTRTNQKGYEEVFIPAVLPPAKSEDGLVPVASLDEFARLVFTGTKFLNRIQSVCFHTAYRSNENMLVCAPTGAGKTNVAMLTVLREISKHISGGVLARDAFKIVYIAPMKALAQEVVEKFSKRLGPLGVIVKELTGDMQLTKHEIAETQMIVTTPEKWDVVTRKVRF
jgi:activating signal cointegrator complex subunit 3